MEQKPTTKEEIQSKREALQKTLREATEAANILSTKKDGVKKIVNENIKDEEFNDFVDNNNVSKNRLNIIAEKIKNGEKLSLREQAIHTSKTSEIEEKLKDKNTGEAKKDVSEEEIRARAQAIYEKRQAEGKEGDEKTDWEEAKDKLKFEKIIKEMKAENLEEIKIEMEQLRRDLGIAEKTGNEKDVLEIEDKIRKLETRKDENKIETPEKNEIVEEKIETEKPDEKKQEDSPEKIEAEIPPVEISPEKISDLEKLIGNIEKDRQDKLDNGPLSLRMKKGVMDGLGKWENYGQGEKGFNGFRKRFTKMAVNMALIGAISSISIEQLAKTTSMVSATALGGGVTSYLGRKMAVGLGLGSIMELGGKLPDKVKKWIPLVMGVGGIAVATVLSGGMAGVVVGSSVALGYLSTKFIKGNFTNEKIADKKEIAKQKLFEKYKIEDGILDLNRIPEFEEEYKKLIIKFENQGIWGKGLDEATKILVGSAVSTVSMGASGYAKDNFGHDQPIVGQKEVGQHHTEHTGTDTEKIIETKNAPEIRAEVQAVADHGQGAVSTLRELQENLKAEYGNNLENAPENVKHILNTNPVDLAKEYGMLNTGQVDESALIKAGSSFNVDSQGNLTYHEIGGNNIILDNSSHTNEVNYSGKMFDADHSGLKVHANIDDSYKVPEQVDPTIGGHEVPTQVDPTINNADYKVPTQVNPTINEQTINTTHSGLSDSINNKSTNLHEADADTKRHLESGIATNTLQIEDLKIVHTISQENINHLFPDNEHDHVWDNIKSKTPESLFKMENENGLNETYKPFTSYLHKIEEVTGLKPITTSILNPIPETNNEYIERALIKAQEMGQLDRVKL